MRFAPWMLASPLTLLPALASAAGPVEEADCDFVIEPATPSATGTELGVSPGDLVCVRAGTREFLRLYDFVGTEAEPIVITNLGGQVQIDNSDRGYGLTGDGMAHVIVTGTGSADVEYGFSVRASRDGPDYSASGVVFAGLSTNYELDHFEVYETGFAGFNLKTEPTCDGSANLGQFTQRDTVLHHNYVHDTRGEGLYLGSTGYGGRDYNCDGEQVTLHPHDHEGFYVYSNIIENTGWDGMQVGITPKGCEIYGNVIRNVGLENEEFQTNGLQIGGASACEVWGNWLENGPTNGMIILDGAATFVHDNVIVGFSGPGIYVNDRANEEVAGSSYAFVHNTIVDVGDNGLTLFAQTTGGHVIKNNVVVDVGGTEIAVGGNVDHESEGNMIGSGADVGFVDLAGRDFHLLEDAAARDAGVDAADYASTHDLDNVPRDEAVDVGAYEWSLEDPDPDPEPGGEEEGGEESGEEGGGDEGGGSDSGGDEAGAEETGSGQDADSGGCACSTAVSPAPAGALTMLALLGLVRRRSPVVPRPRGPVRRAQEVDHQ